VLLCALLAGIQHVVDSELEKPRFRCGCVGTDCGVQHSTPTQALSCAVPAPPRWPALVQVPDAQRRAQTRFHPWPCNKTERCPATVLVTGHHRRLAQGTCMFCDFFLMLSLEKDFFQSLDLDYNNTFPLLQQYIFIVPPKILIYAKTKSKLASNEQNCFRKKYINHCLC
jgi:hypothetical protein